VQKANNSLVFHWAQAAAGGNRIDHHRDTVYKSSVYQWRTSIATVGIESVYSVVKSTDANRTAEFRFLWLHRVEQSAICWTRQEIVTERVRVEDKDIFSDSFTDERHPVPLWSFFVNSASFTTDRTYLLYREENISVDTAVSHRNISFRQKIRD